MPLLSWVIDKIPRRFLFFVRLLAGSLLCIVFIQPSATRAEGIKLSNELNYSNSDSKITEKNTNETVTSGLESVKQRYSLDMSRSLYPYLTFNGGAFYQGIDTASTFSETESERKEKMIRPFADLNLESPVFKAGIGVRKTQMEENEIGSPDSMNERDEVNALLGWKPTDLPEMNVRFGNIQTYNNLDTLDSGYKQVNFDTKYNAWKDLRLNYFFNRAETIDDVGNFNIEEQAHNAMADYSHSFFNNRLSLNTGYRTRQTSIAFPGTESVESPVSRSGGFSALDDTPQQGEFAVNNALIDGEKALSTGLDIGLAGDETKLTQMMIDFGFPVSVDKIHLWVDRRLTSIIANSFSWSVYTSPGTISPTEWTLLTVISPASFASIDNRFEIAFPAVKTRFIKIVTRPISISVPNANEFQNIFVTEMEVFTALTGEDALNKNTTLDQNYNLNLNGKLTDRTLLGYNFFYRARKEDLFLQERTEYSSGVYLNHVFNDMFAANTNILRTDNQNAGNDSVNYTFATSLRANYLETLDQTLTYSGLRETNEEWDIERHSLILRTNTKLYRGVNAFLDNGYGIEKTVDDNSEESALVLVGTNIVPNEKIGLNTNYALTKILKTENEDRKLSDSQLDFQVYFTPLSALSFNARVSLVDRDNTATTYQNFSVSWLPFPEGALQLFFIYFEALTPEDNKKDRTLNPSLQWKVSQYVNVNASYSYTQSETDTFTTDTNSFNTILRLVF
ncbi:MAG: hypothetical protein C0403_17380 [Desulfobacterium sp.]|nr:hypothetical protein [Desulfobacterium sp.]